MEITSKEERKEENEMAGEAGQEKKKEGERQEHD